MNHIRNILFDLGGVLMNLDYNKTTDAFKQLGYTNFEKMYTGLKMNNVFDNFETGKLGEEDFYKYMLDEASLPVSKDQVTHAWNAMLLDFREDSLGFLKELAKSHKLFLLSNTNIIHKRAFDKNFEQQTGIPSIDIYFTKAYYSHIVGLRKPTEDIFRFVAKDAGINPGETLFIDDIYDNIETATRLEFKTYHFKPGDKVEALDYY